MDPASPSLRCTFEQVRLYAGSSTDNLIMLSDIPVDLLCATVVFVYVLDLLLDLRMWMLAVKLQNVWCHRIVPSVQAFLPLVQYAQRQWMF